MEGQNTEAGTKEMHGGMAGILGDFREFGLPDFGDILSSLNADDWGSMVAEEGTSDAGFNPLDRGYWDECPSFPTLTGKKGLDPWSDEHTKRNCFNRCPLTKPSKQNADGTYQDHKYPEIKWELSGRTDSKYHGYDFGFRTFRALDPSHPGSGFQCTYDPQGNLHRGEFRGTYDYFSPDISTLGHLKFDLAPHYVNGHYHDPDFTAGY